MTFRLDWKRNPRGILFVIVQSISHIQLFATPWTAAHQASLSSTIFWSLPKFMSVELLMLSNHPVLCHPLLLLPSIFPSIRVFSNELALRIRWPKYWSFSISPSNEYSGLISFRINWFALLAVPGTLKSLIIPWGTLSPGISNEFTVLPLQPGLRLWLVTGLSPACGEREAAPSGSRVSGPERMQAASASPCLAPASQGHFSFMTFLGSPEH